MNYLFIHTYMYVYIPKCTYVKTYKYTLYIMGSSRTVFQGTCHELSIHIYIYVCIYLNVCTLKHINIHYILWDQVVLYIKVRVMNYLFIHTYMYVYIPKCTYVKTCKYLLHIMRSSRTVF
jgi:hypothetical protein